MNKKLLFRIIHYLELLIINVSIFFAMSNLYHLEQVNNDWSLTGIELIALVVGGASFYNGFLWKKMIVRDRPQQLVIAFFIFNIILAISNAAISQSI